MDSKKAINFFKKKIAAEHMSWWKYKQEIEHRRDLFTVEKEALVDKAYSQYKAKETEIIEIIDSIYYEDVANEIPVYNR